MKYPIPTAVYAVIVGIMMFAVLLVMTASFTVPAVRAAAGKHGDT